MMKQHPLSAAFPSMSLADLAVLTDDIATHGLRQPVVVFEGQVLDGWHRYSACKAAGVEPATVEFDPDDDPVAFVLSMNLSRRHLSASQRAAAVVACATWAPTGRPEKGAPGAPFQQSNESMAKAAEVALRTIKQAKRAVEAGLGEAVRDGKVSVKRAAQVAKLPPEQRQEALEQPAPKKRRMRIVDEVPPAAAKEEAEPEADDTSRAADIVAEYESLLRIVEADDKAAEAWAEAKAMAAKCDEWRRMYEAKCAELAATQKEARRWMRRAQTLEKGAAK